MSRTEELIKEALEISTIKKRLIEINLEMDHLIDMQKDLVKEADKLHERCKKIK
jgi:predicted transcriptional regulator